MRLPIPTVFIAAWLLALTLVAPLPAQALAGYRQIAPGVFYHQDRRQTKAGPMAVNVLRMDPRRAAVRSLMVQKKGGGFGRAKVSQIAKAYGAVAAINGSYFSFKSNEPAGLMVVDGQIVSSSPYNRSVFGVRYDGTPFIDNARVTASVLLDSGAELPIRRVNRQAKPNQLTLYTPHWGPSTRTRVEARRFEAAIDPTGTVIEVSNGNLPIPKGGYVISANGQAYAAMLRTMRPGGRAQVYTKLASRWEGVRYAVGGGPTILRHGRVKVTARREGFSSTISSGRAPRTAIGYMADGETLMVTVDGRHPHHSVGCTLYELARLMKDLGAIDAINLDGGGSSVMVIGGKPVNQVSAGSERYVSNAIGVFVPGYKIPVIAARSGAARKSLR